MFSLWESLPDLKMQKCCYIILKVVIIKHAGYQRCKLKQSMQKKVVTSIIVFDFF